MKKLKKHIAYLLCLAMLLSLVGCTQEPTPTDPSTQPATEPTEAPTEPPAEELYAQAIAAVLAMEDLELTMEMVETRTLGGETFTTRSSQTILYHGLGTDAFTASVEDRTYYGTDSVSSQEYYADGTGYVTLQNVNFRSPMTAEEFTDCFLPVVLLEESLYESITSEPAGKGLTLTFSGAETLETWLGNDFTVPVEISGTARLDSQDALTETEYSATYTQGGMTVEVTASVTIAEPETIPDLTGTIQLLQTDAVEISHLSLPFTLLGACGDVAQASSITAERSVTRLTQAGGWLSSTTATYDLHGLNTDFSYHLDATDSYYDSSNTSDVYTYSEDYLENVYTYTFEDEEPVTNYTIGPSSMRSFLEEDLVGFIPSLKFIASMDMEVTASNLVVSYTLNEDGAQAWYESICESQFSEPDVLDNLASDYRTDEMSGYISIDLATELPVAIASTYTGIHTIEGEEYILSEDFCQSLFLGSDTAYETIHGEPLPEEEPEEKATPVFYHVTGESGQEMWLLGTIHIGDARTAYLPQEIYDAFDDSDALAVEFDLTAFEENMETDEDLIAMVMENYYYTDGTSLADHIDPELYEQTILALKAIGSYNANGSVEYMRASALTSFFDGYSLRQSYTLSSDKGVDRRLLERAKETGKEILDVESAEAQMSMEANYSEDLQELLLSESVSYPSLSYIAGSLEMYELWCQGDEDTLRSYFSDEASDSDEEEEELTPEEQALMEEYTKAMETDRNVGMLDVAKEYLESGKVVFYAVGLAHLLAEDGLVNTLREAGYTVELVPYQ